MLKATPLLSKKMSREPLHFPELKMQAKDDVRSHLPDFENKI
jgi:hypothetical protein